MKDEMYYLQAIVMYFKKNMFRRDMAALLLLKFFLVFALVYWCKSLKSTQKVERYEILYKE